MENQQQQEADEEIASGLVVPAAAATTTTSYIRSNDTHTIVHVVDRFTGVPRGELYFLELWRPKIGSSVEALASPMMVSSSPSPSSTPARAGRRRSSTGKRKRFPLVCLKRFPSVHLVGPYERETLIGPFELEEGKRHLTEFKRATRTTDECTQYALELVKQADVLRWIEFTTTTTPDVSSAQQQVATAGTLENAEMILQRTNE